MTPGGGALICWESLALSSTFPTLRRWKDGILSAGSWSWNRMKARQMTRKKIQRKMQDLYTIYKFDVYCMYIGIWNEEYWKQEDGGGAWGSVEEDDRQPEIKLNLPSQPNFRDCFT
ncbi:hypothetical protein OsI_02495 [Oryza sativa Indica Group]|uniref:Uncharacterized protein n=1 Tax=Oryza sativa subsp. indica TaxID=39946 RepID=A2WRL0_ORYSI|nr:hypothetical protein OsI_02495 [Oryza sativa Indica Group]